MKEGFPRFIIDIFFILFYSAGVAVLYFETKDMKVPIAALTVGMLNYLRNISNDIQEINKITKANDRSNQHKPDIGERKHP